MKKIVFSIFITLVFNICAGQQLDTLSSDKSFHHRCFGMYFIFPKLELSSASELNPFLIQNEFPTLPRQTFNWGMGLHYRSGLFLLNTDVMVTQQQRENSNSRTEFRRSILSTSLNFAYYIHKSEVNKAGNTIAFYPFSGLSMNQTNLYLSRPTQNQSIEQLLNSPNNTSQIEHFAIGINIGAGIDITRLHEQGMTLIGIRAGYRFSPEGAYEWESSFTNITDAPSDSFEHFFIQVNLGLGYNWKKGAFLG